jgi:phospholipase/carboxylesterase
MRANPTTTALAAANGRLLSRPSAPPRGPRPVGIAHLNLGAGRDGLLYVPECVRTDAPAPLCVVLHGAGGDAADMLGALQDAADAAGAVLLVPESRGGTWDVLHGGFGPDVAFVDAALEAACARVPVDGARVAIAGFSDGASYALSLGLANGDLFRQVIAFSPGFSAPPSRTGWPRVFVSHGTRDAVLPIDPCSRAIVPRLRGAGYEVIYEEFPGRHEVPAELAAQALETFVAGN